MIISLIVFSTSFVSTSLVLFAKWQETSMKLKSAEWRIDSADKTIETLRDELARVTAKLDQLRELAMEDCYG